MFAPADGVPEDPATGSAAGPLAVHLARHGRIEFGQEIEIRQGAEEFTLGGGPTGVLLIHGFTGSPHSMRGLGEYLADRGLSARGLRLPGHATSWQDCNTKKAKDWLEAVDEEFERFSAAHEEVFVVGLSFGATLAVGDFDADWRHDFATLLRTDHLARGEQELRLTVVVHAPRAHVERRIGAWATIVADEGLGEINRAIAQLPPKVVDSKVERRRQTPC